MKSYILFEFISDIYTMLEQQDFDRFEHLLREIPEFLDSLRDSESNSFLMKAVCDGNKDVFRRLLSYPQDFSIVDRENWNVFNWVSLKQNNEWFEMLKEKMVRPHDLIQLINQKSTIFGQTPLHCAAGNNNHKAIKWLLENQADVNERNNEGKLADRYTRCDEETKRLFRDFRQRR